MSTASSPGKRRHTLVDWRAAARVARRLCCWVASISSRESESRLSARRIPATSRNRGFIARSPAAASALPRSSGAGAVLCVDVVMTQMVVITPCLRNRRRYQIPPVDGKGFPTRGVSTGLVRCATAPPPHGAPAERSLPQWRRLRPQSCPDETHPRYGEEQDISRKYGLCIVCLRVTAGGMTR